MATKTYKCSSCDEEYETEKEANECCGGDEEGNSPEESLIMVDGEVKRGHFECQDKECGWTGSEEETKSINMANMKRFTLPSGESVYTGSTIEERDGDTEQPDLIIRTCPNCDSAKIKFVPEVVSVNKKDVSI